jgi:hypothetical protein
MFNPRTMTLIAMILAAATTRVLPHPWNFTAVGAMCLFGGATFPRRWAAFAVPMIALAISDVAIAYLQYGGDLSTMTPFKYLLFAATVGMGMLLRGRTNFTTVTGMAIAASVMFFVVSNFQVWLDGKLYPMTAEGLVACYIAAIPFAQNMLYANLFYSAVLFGGLHLMQLRWPALENPLGRKLAMAKVAA